MLNFVPVIVSGIKGLLDHLQRQLDGFLPSSVSIDMAIKHFFFIIAFIIGSALAAIPGALYALHHLYRSDELYSK